MPADRKCRDQQSGTEVGYRVTGDLPEQLAVVRGEIDVLMWHARDLIEATFLKSEDV